MFPAEIQEQRDPGNHQQRRNNFGLRWVPSKNVVFRVNPDLLDKKAFNSIDNKIYREHRPGNREATP